MGMVKTTCMLTVLWAAVSAGAVRTGLDRVSEHAVLLAERRVGIIANHASRDSEGRHIVDVLHAMRGVRVVALFSPEHGFRGSAEAGEAVGSGVDPVSGLPVFSLYGKTKKPTPEMLADIDVLAFDMQDVGARFYTYLYTMSLAMEAAAECGKRFIVLDRPNPITGLHVEGAILEPRFASFVGLYPIPVRYGLTIGELARTINGEGWLANGVRADLTVIPMTGWDRDTWYDETGLPWIKPSPNMPDVETAAVYPGLCLLEGTNISEGRGTPRPFRQFGAPWIDGETLAARLNALDLPGLRFRSTSFTPTSSKHQDRLCHGVELTVTDRTELQPFGAGLAIIDQLFRACPDHFEWRPAHFDRLCGTAIVREAIIAGSPLTPLFTRWSEQATDFQRATRKYRLYAD
jgi:uncharacterized protein YbbC (DUF1343 family)